MAEFSDWEMHSAQASDLDLGAKLLGFKQGDGVTADGVRYSIYLYGTKYVRSTTQTFVDVYGNTQFAMVAQPGAYGILRWYSTKPFPPTGLNLPPRITIVPLPADSPVRFA